MSVKPNILLITADQFRADCLGCAGNPIIRTPHLDRIAERGVRFTHAFSPNPICVPARASIMTGNYPHVCTGHKSNAGRIRDGQPLLTSVLKSEGYRAYASGKLHFAPYSPPGQPRLLHGFDHVDLMESGRILAEFDPCGKLEGLEDYFDYLKTVGWPKYTRGHGIGNNDVRPCPSPLPAEHYVDHWIADCTLRTIDRHVKDYPGKPFFMWMSSPKPHSPYDPPRPWDTLYDPRAFPFPVGNPELLASRDPFIEQLRHTHALSSIGPETWQVIRSYYYGSISFLDAMIGRVVDHLEQQGQLENTIILFTSDHGDLLGDFGSCFKAHHQDASVRIPFLAAGPGVVQGARCDALVGLQDILPTLADAAGATLPAEVQGRSLGAIFAEPGGSVRDYYYSSTKNPCGQSAMVTDGRWKYIYSEANATEELYDRKNDPGELLNLAVDPAWAERTKEWRDRLEGCAREYADGELLEAGCLKSRAVDVAALSRLPVKGMGWRWY